MKTRSLGLALCLVLLVGGTAEAAKGRAAQSAPPTESFICIEATTGLVLEEQNADVVRPPASMIKMILMLLVAEGLEQGQWTLDYPITITPAIEAIGGSQAYLQAGETFVLGDLMAAVAVWSANDAAEAVAEALWGSVPDYLEAANRRVQELGMRDTVVRTANGLPPDRGQLPDQTTARDMAILAQQCIQHPTIMQWVGMKEFTLRPGHGGKGNTNRLLYQMPGCDGLKTGFTSAAGWCLTATAVRDNIRLISVIMGCQNKSSRFNYAQNVLERGFGNVTRECVIAKGQVLDPPVEVRNCAKPAVQLAAAEDVWAIVPTEAVSQLEVVTERPRVLQAPLAAGTVIGTVQVRLNGRTLSSAPLMVPEELDVAGWKWKMQDSVRRSGERLRRSRSASAP
jgi:D-alanyl-D-alanine carboxypeptidase (penicillin-binding protein 5/6)